MAGIFPAFELERQPVLMAEGPPCPALPLHCLCQAYTGLWVMEWYHWGVSANEILQPPWVNKSQIQIMCLRGTPALPLTRGNTLEGLIKDK